MSLTELKYAISVERLNFGAIPIESYHLILQRCSTIWLRLNVVRGLLLCMAPFGLFFWQKQREKPHVRTKILVQEVASVPLLEELNIGRIFSICLLTYTQTRYWDRMFLTCRQQKA